MSYSFWKIIEQAKKDSSNWKSRPEKLKIILMNHSPKDIIRFNKDYHNKLIQAYCWDLWGAAYLINDGCSDDGFYYWRSFLISEGKSVYEAALDDPDSLAELDDIKYAELEEYCYSIDKAYKELTSNEIPEEENIAYPNEPAGDKWDEKNLNFMFPRLAEKYD